MKKLLAGKLSMPFGVDCWYCAVFAQKGNKVDNEHLISHFKDRYYVSSLIVRAIEMYPVSPIAKITLSNLFRGRTDNTVFRVEQLKKSLYRYICKQFDIA